MIAMKYRIFLCLSVILLLLSGCSKVNINTPTEPTKSFSCTANVKFRGNNFQCNIARQEQGLIQFDFTAPETLDGMSFKWLGDKYETSYKNLCCNTDSSILPDTSFVSEITEILNITTTQQNSLKKNNHDDITDYEGDLNGAAFTVSVNNKTGAIQNISSSSLELDVNFTDFQS